MTCRNKCKEFKVHDGDKGGRYDNGQKRCTRCSVFMIYDGFHCPCCGQPLRAKPRTRKGKERLRKLQNDVPGNL